MKCHDTTMSLGVYLLGALDPLERAEVESHLQKCAECRLELNELAALPSVLDQLTVDDIAASPAPAPEDLFERVAAPAPGETIAGWSRLPRRSC
jgi:anti-sigma factor RsiW